MHLFKSFGISTVLVAMLVGASSAWAQTTGPVQPTGTWTAETAGSYSCYYGGSATDGTYLYTLGGYWTGSYPHEYYGAFFRYNPTTNAWNSGLPVTYMQINWPVGSTTVVRIGPWSGSGGFHNGYLYLMGGYYYIQTAPGATTYTAAQGGIMRYNVSTNSGVWEWVTPPSQPTTMLQIHGNRYYMSSTAAKLNDKFYLGGGYNTNTGSVTTPANNTVTWTTSYSALMTEFTPANVGTTTSPIALMASMTTPRYFNSNESIPSLNKAYVIGGQIAALPYYSNSIEEFTPPTSTDLDGSWANKATFNMTGNTTYPGCYGAIALTIGNRIYLTGGYNGYQTPYYFATTFEYEPVTDTWLQRGNMTVATGQGRYLHMGAVITASEGSPATTKARGYVYGSGYSLNTAERYEAPEFGSPPPAPTAVAQAGARPETALQSQADQNQFDGWTNTQVSFSANVTDPDAGQQVRFRVQVKPQAAAWTQTSAIVNLATPLGAQGVHTLNWTIPAGGGFDWRWRVEDAFANSYPITANTWVEAFGTLAAQNTTSPDFRSDQVAPADPVALSPSSIDIQVPDPVIGPVMLQWIEATDNGPVAGISYEIQVATEGGFQNIEAQLFSTAGTSSYPVSLTVSSFDKFWRIRARDVGGNLSAWSGALHFRVTYNDGLDHSAGDAKKNCGFSASASPAIAAAFLGVLVLAFALRRKLA